MSDKTNETNESNELSKSTESLPERKKCGCGSRLKRRKIRRRRLSK